METPMSVNADLSVRTLILQGFSSLKMSGQYGNAQRTVRKLEVVSLDKEAGLVFVKGAVPGRASGYVYIKKMGSTLISG